MNAHFDHSRESENPCAATVLEAACRSVGSALLTEAQQQALDTLFAEVNELCARNREADARRTMKVALSLIAGGPPVAE